MINQLFGFLASVCPGSAIETYSPSMAPSNPWKMQAENSAPSALLTR